MPIWKKSVAARRGLCLFFVFLILFSSLADWSTLAAPRPWSSFLLMWSPGLAAMLTRLMLREGWSDVPFRLGGKRTWIALFLGILTPLTVALTTYGLAWSTGLTALTTFQPSASLQIALTLLGTHVPLLITSLLIFSFFAAELIYAFGEELGWRGYMLTRLIDAGVPYPILVSGLIWSLWHWPLIFLTAPHLGLSTLYSALIFLVTITSLGYIAARLRLSTGSIWPSVVLHAAWNACMVEIFASLNRADFNSHITGESGILVAAVMSGISWIFWHRSRNDGIKTTTHAIK